MLFVCLVDNGSYYYNIGMFLYLVEVNRFFNLVFVEYNNFEVGKGKMVLDIYFVYINYKIV